MTLKTVCDYCGEEQEGNMYVEVGGRGWEPGEKYTNVYYGHYCSRSAGYGESSCYERVVEAIHLVNAVGPTLDSIETLPDHEVRRQRARLTRPGESIGELDITVRTYKLFQRAELYTVDLLTAKSRGELMAMIGMGSKSLREVEEALQQRGLKLRDEER